MSAHTPGPWRFWTQKRTVGEDTCTFQNLKGEEVLRAVTVTITEADAWLIAAAPELLAALRDLQVRYTAMFEIYKGTAYSRPEDAKSDLDIALATSNAAIENATRASP